LFKFLIVLAVLFVSASPSRGADQNPQSTEAVDQLSKPAANAAANSATKPAANPAANPATNPATNAATNDATKPSPNPAQNAQLRGALKPIKLQAEEDYWIDPDRPHIADSSVNVPKGLWLQENGFQQSYINRNSRIFDFSETLIRVGVASRLELRYNAPDFFTSTTRTVNPNLAAVNDRMTSFQNMQGGFKARVGPLGPTKFELAVNPYVTIPSGFYGQSTKVDPNVKFPFSQRLNDKWDIEGMQSFFDPTINGHRNADWQNSLVLNRSWGRQKNVFIEYVGDLFEHGPMSNLIHFGGAYRPNRREQFDTQFGFRMNNAAPIAFFGFGYSFLLGNMNTPELTPSRFNKP
jgi:hypothetical protein